MGFAEENSHPSPGGLLPHHFTLTKSLRPWRYLSVALSLALRPVDVIDHLARWSPDFPPPESRFAKKQSEERLPSLPTSRLYHRDSDQRVELAVSDPCAIAAIREA